MRRKTVVPCATDKIRYDRIRLYSTPEGNCSVAQSKQNHCEEYKASNTDKPNTCKLIFIHHHPPTHMHTCSCTRNSISKPPLLALSARSHSEGSRKQTTEFRRVGGGILADTADNRRGTHLLIFFWPNKYRRDKLLVGMRTLFYRLSFQKFRYQEHTLAEKRAGKVLSKFHRRSDLISRLGSITVAAGIPQGKQPKLPCGNKMSHWDNKVCKNATNENAIH